MQEGINASEIAIEALEALEKQLEDRWVPVSEGLPVKDGIYQGG